MRLLLQIGLLLLATHSLSFLPGQAGQAQGLTNPLLDPNFWPTAPPEAVRTEVEQGADLTAWGEFGQTPLHFAARFNTNPEVIRVLVEHGAEVSSSTGDGWTPLHLAAEHNTNPEVIRLLVELGADVNEIDIQGFTPLHNAAAHNTNHAVIRLLVAFSTLAISG